MRRVVRLATASGNAPQAPQDARGAPEAPRQPRTSAATRKRRLKAARASYEGGSTLAEAAIEARLPTSTVAYHARQEGWKRVAVAAPQTPLAALCARVGITAGLGILERLLSLQDLIDETQVELGGGPTRFGRKRSRTDLEVELAMLRREYTEQEAVLLPYIYPRLATSAVGGPDGGPVEVRDRSLEALLEWMNGKSLAPPSQRTSEPPDLDLLKGPEG